MYSITITPEALSGQAAQVFFAYLREKITIVKRCCFMQADKEYLYTPKQMSAEIYTLQVKQSVVCYLSTTSSKEPLEPWYYVNYVDTANIVGRGGFATVFNISAIYQCTATALTEIPITIPLVVKIQDYCQCETMAKVSCSRHNPKILGFEESRISKTIPHLGVQAVLFNLRISYTVMLKMPGRPLCDIILDDLKRHNILTFQQRMDLTQLLLQALWSQAPNLIHRDIKPANIMVCLESGVVRLIDYQFALKIPPGSDSIQTDCVVGSQNYKAPENSYNKTQTNSSITLTQKADVFSLARVLMQIWAKSRKSFTFATAQELMHYIQHDLIKLEFLFEGITDLPLGMEFRVRLKSFIQGMVQLNPQHRYSIEEAITAFQSIYQDVFTPRPPLASKASPAEPTQPLDDPEKRSVFIQEAVFFKAANSPNITDLPIQSLNP